MSDLAADVWVHPDVRVRDSTIAGQGLFVTAPMPADTPLIRLGGRVVTTDELHRLFEQADARGDYVDTFAFDIDLHLVLPPDTVAHYANHSCDPSTWFGGPLELVARHDLDVGAELTIDYGVISDDPTFRIDCTCGVHACREVVTGSDWQRADLRTTHRGRWPAGLQRRIDAATASD